MTVSNQPELAPMPPIPGGIGVQDITCWYLVYANGTPVDTGDSEPHYDTEDEARREAPMYAVESLGRPEPHQLAAPCWIAWASCGYRLDEENTTLMHHESADAALRTALDSGMFVGPCGHLHCSPECDDCRQDCSPLTAAHSVGQQSAKRVASP